MGTTAAVALLLLAATPEGVAPKAGYANVNGVKHYYEVHGAGAPVVLLHGGISSFQTSFERVSGDLARRYQVVGIERVGHGHTADSDRPLSYEGMADDTAAVLGQLGLGQVDLIGWSDGGIVSLLVASKYPQLVRKVVVLGSSTSLDGVQPDFQRRLRGMTPEELVKVLGKERREAYERVSPDGPGHWPVIVAKIKDLWLSRRVEKEQLVAIQAEVLVIAGDRDIWATPEHSVEIFRSLRRGRLWIVPGTGHDTLISRTPWALPVITDFLDAPDKADGAAGIASVTEGRGTPLFIVHGAWNDLRSFSGAVPMLAEGSTVTRVSLRLHWPNPWPATEKEAYDSYLMENHAADVVKAIERSGRVPVDLLGHSYGGAIAFLVARTRPELVRRLILVEPSLQRLLEGDPDGEKLLASARAVRDSRLAKLRAGATPLELVRGMYDESHPGTFDSFPERRRRILIENARTMGPGLVHSWIDFPVTCKDAGALRMPVLVVEGEKTTAVMHAIAKALLPCIPDARHVVLPGATHAIQFDAPEAMARAVAEFVAR
jgi:pimeloyl-ACP methyl ester carboxylesterase